MIRIPASCFGGHSVWTLHCRALGRRKVVERLGAVLFLVTGGHCCAAEFQMHPGFAGEFDEEEGEYDG